jgi:iron complex outermembrane receptor protein
MQSCNRPKKVPHNMKATRLLFFLSLLSAAGLACAADFSEQDYFTDLPVILSVSRLAQPLNETPGAVTVLDRDMIRRSGARELAELMRLVPGFIVTHIEGGNRPNASYHADYDAITRHLQVFIDGRSAYSSLLVGTASFGMMGIVLEDIERIEVLRGSNSAAYGANAFQGVINIVTRHAADTLGGMVSVSGGEAGVRDGVARVGWGNENAAFRLTAATRNDNGFRDVYDNKRLTQAHFRSDLQPTHRDEVMLLAGHADLTFGGLTSSFGPQDEIWRNSYARAQWTHRLDSQAELKVSVTADEEKYRNFYPALRADGTSRRLAFEASHSFVANDAWRFVWGGHYRREQVVSPDLFTEARADQNFNLWQLFGNAEWRPHAQWLINLGGLWENHSIIGSSTAPRLMANFHALPGHTLRVGTTTAYKQPTLFELRTDWRSEGQTMALASGNVRPERIDATEIGYLGQFRPLNLTVDVRGFIEKVSDLLGYWRPCNGCPRDIVNQRDNTQRGWETQLRWQPWADTQIILNHTELRLIPASNSISIDVDPYRAPQHYSSLALFQRLPEGVGLTVIHGTSQPYFWIRKSDMIPAFRQTDVRLSKEFHIGTTRTEAAVFVRAISGGHADFVQRGHPEAYLDKRIHATLRFDF